MKWRLLPPPVSARCDYTHPFQLRFAIAESGTNSILFLLVKMVSYCFLRYVLFSWVAW